MRGKNSIKSTLLALLLALAMIITYMTAPMITYAAEGTAGEQEIEITADEEGLIEEELLIDDSSEELLDAADEEEVALNEVEPEEEDAEVQLSASADGSTVLAFTSDTHNKSDNTAANRLGSWIDKMVAKYGDIDAMAFGGDMANASASTSDYWVFTQADMTQLANRSVDGVYTTGNHEHSPGNISSQSNDASKKFKITAEGAVGDNFRIFCLGSSSSSQQYTTDQINTLTTYLNNAGNSKVIFIITHFPLNYCSSSWGWGGRSTTNASNVIDVLNNAATKNGQKIVFLWGHNHTESDPYYDEIYAPGRSIQYDSSNSKEINFYYGAAGCMSDSEYSTGSAYVKGKGLIVTIDSQNKLTFTYHDENGNDVTEGGSYTEKDPVEIKGVTLIGTDVQPLSALTLETGKTLQLNYSVTPEDATVKSVSWNSSNTKVATVDSTGKVKGIKEGNAAITVTLSDGITRGTAVASVDVTVTPRSSTGGTTYTLTDSIEEGGEYLIVSSKSNGDAYALKNPGATSSGANPGATSVYVDSETIETEDEDIIWTAGTRLSGFELLNDENAILAGKNGDLGIYTLASDPYADRYWTYDGTYLQYKGGSYTYELYYENGFTARSFNSGNPSHPVYIYERTSSQVPVTGVSVNPTTLELKRGRTGTITATVSPTGASKRVTWSSDTPTVATVNSNGKVSGVGAGTARITATSVADPTKSATCTVTVVEPQPGEGMTYVLTDKLEDGQDYLIATGNSGSVYILSNEAGSSRQLKGVSVEVVDDAITIEDDTVTEKVEFTAEKKTSQSGADSFWLNNGGQYLYTNNANGLKVSSDQTDTDNTGKFWHYKADNKNLLWYFKDTSSSDGYTDTSQTYKYYLECSNGVFTDNHVSTTSLANSNTPAIYLFVKDDSTPQPVSGVTLDKSSLTLKTGRTATLTATVLPRNAENKNITWKSSNPAVATVNNGVVTAVAAGTTTITVTTVQGGYTATCQVTVKEAGAGTNYVLTDKLEAGQEYLIANGNTGNVYIVSNEAGSARQLKGISVEVVGDTITLDDETIAKAVFSCTANSNSAQSGLWLMNGSQYLYADSNDGLRLVASSTQTSSSNNAKSWHYRGDGKELLWFFKDTSSQNGYTDTSSTYKYYLECSSGVFTDNHVSTTSLSNSNTPKVYLFVKDDTPPVHTHTYGTPVYAWASDNSTCTATATCSGCDASTEGHTVTETVNAAYAFTKEATFTAALSGTYTATFTNSLFAAQTQTKEIAALGHDLVATAAKDATCEAAGNSAYWTCSRCGKFFSDAAGTTEIAENSWIIPAKGHTPVTDAAVAPTCTETGLTEGSHCSTCGTVITAQTVVPALGHDLVHHEAQAATCTAAGWDAYDTCSRCDYTTYEEIPAKGHSYGTPKWAWAADNSSATATFTCSVCSDTQTIDAEITTETTEATCEEAGKTVYNATAIFDGKPYSYGKEVEIPAKGHTEEIIPGKAATCTEAGITDGKKCSVCGKTLVEQKEIAALGHSYGDPKWTWSKDHSMATAKFTCKNCGESQTETATVTSKTNADGSTTYTAKAAIDGKTYTDTYTQKAENVPVIGILVTQQNKEMLTLKTQQIKAEVQPANATNKAVTWKSSDPAIATVDANGKVTAKTIGTVTITATTKDGGYQGTCTIKVKFNDAYYKLNGTNESNVTEEMAKAIYWASDKKITGEKTSFGTFNNMTRGQFVRFLYRYAGNPKVTNADIKKYGAQFTDVEKGYTHYNAIVWAVKKGLIDGYTENGKTVFKPEKSLSRNNVATILWKYAGSKVVSNIKNPFKDVSKSKALAWVKEAKIYTGTKFYPKDDCLRGDFAVFLYRYDKNVGKK